MKNLIDINRKKYVPFYTMKELVNAMAKNYKVWSWGAHAWTSIEGKFLMFVVNGHHHKGRVFIGVNGLDLFDIYLAKKNGEIIQTIENVYLEDLIDTIDTKVERISDYIR